MVTEKDTSANLVNRWTTQGYAMVHELIGRDEASQLLLVCEDILQQWYRRAEPGPGEFDHVMRHLNHPGYFKDHPEWLPMLLEIAADPRVLDFARQVLREEPVYRLFSLFMNPLEDHRDGHWHRDTQFVQDYDEEDERARLAGDAFQNCIQLQIALVPSADAEVVPGSHLRWDTPEEWEIRLKDNKAHNKSNDMPGALRADLAVGDAVAFNPCAIHRGRYHTDKLRRTLMLTYEGISTPVKHDIFNRQPWFLNDGYLVGVSEETRRFHGLFVEKYREGWE